MQETYRSLVQAGDLKPDVAQEAVLHEFQRLTEALNQPKKRGFLRKSKAEDIKGLYIWGGVGRGKSMLMDLFVASLDVPNRRVHFHAFMQEVHAAMHDARAQGTADALMPFAEKIASDVRLLALDEMQITDITDAMIVGRLFQALIERGVVVVTTSNRPPEELYKDGLNRQLFLPFIGMLHDKMVVHHLSSDADYRQDRLQGAQVYFVPADAEARAQMSAIWADLTGENGAPLELVVKGRKLLLPRFHNGVGRATFFDLCAQPLGPADYLAIAEAVRVLMLEDIPLLGRSNFNEAKRFVTLIDALYEARVRLIASAAAKPEMLYVEGTGAFEFERTASRLREMQSEGWGD